ncbi:MAG TPA: NUDIX domain-containing protein [Candidatus Acidoferrum sp.]|nr:NUDIX domain-containing protein [Candidatus Acidoferrum sp.]
MKPAKFKLLRNRIDEIPSFGERIEGQAYIIRPSAYALVRNGEGSLAIARTVRGWFLPGGGMDGGETVEETSLREAREECGLVLKIRPVKEGGLILRAVDIVYSEEERQFFEKRCTFVVAEIARRVDAAEKVHELLWMSLEEAAQKLSPPSHRWAVERLIENDGPHRQ